MKMCFSVFLSLILSSAAVAGIVDSREQGAQFIRKIAGCYEVTFEFNETFTSPAASSRSAPYREMAKEWITVDYDVGNEVHLQHMLIISPQGGGGVQKHWREEWTYQPQKIMQFISPSRWTMIPTAHDAVQGMWSQRVLNVDDSPRYDCAAPVIAYGSTQYWECFTHSPLPRREFSKRSDYNVLGRRNRIEFGNNGWVHEEDNEKLIFEQGAFTRIAREKGYNTYRKINDSECLSAEREWARTKAAWNVIQSMWRHMMDHHPDFKFDQRNASGLLYEKLFALADEFSIPGVFDESVLAKRAHDTIHQHFFEATK